MLRHTYATRCLAATAYVAGCSGCSAMPMCGPTMRYVHIAGDELHDRVEATFVREPIALDVDSEAA